MRREGRVVWAFGTPIRVPKYFLRWSGGIVKNGQRRQRAYVTPYSHRGMSVSATTDGDRAGSICVFINVGLTYS